MTNHLAYLDFTTASTITTMFVGGFAAVAVTMKFYWLRLLVFLHIRKPEDMETQPQPDAT